MPVAHPGARDPPQPRGDPGDLPARDARRRPGAHRRAAAAGHGRPRAPAGAVPARQGRRSPAPTSASPRPGTLLVVESEGNGRMCLTLPETLITVMGIEKVVPTWPDLEVFLQLLPRSSTGERMNPYTSAWTGVTPGRRAAGVPPGAARQRPHGGAGRPGRARRRCTASGARPASTSARSTSAPAGTRTARSTRARSARCCRRSSPGWRTTPSLPYASSLCGACFDACPVRIDIPSLLVHLRAAHVEATAADAVPTPEAVGMAAAVVGDGRPAAVRRRREGHPRGPRCSAGPRAGSARCRRRCRAGRPAATPPRPPPRRSASGGPASAGRRRRERARRRCCAGIQRRERRPAARRAAVPEVPRDYRRAGAHPPGAPELLELLRDRLVDYRATVLDAAPDDIPAVVARALAEHRRPGAGAARPARRLVPGRRAATAPSPRPSWTASPPSSPRARPPAPRPARSPSTARPTRAAAPSPWCPTCTSAWCAPTRSCTPCPS